MTIIYTPIYPAPCNGYRDTERGNGTPCCDVAAQHIHVEQDESLAETAGVFKALADETRLRLLKAIASAGELCECYAVPASG